jgi:hypothetical protein
MGTTASPSFQPGSTLAQDIRRTFAPGARVGAIQGLIPILVLLVLIVFFPAFISNPFSPILIYLGLLPLLATGAIDVLASWRVARRTYSVRAGVLTCLWANLWFAAGSTVVVLGDLWYLGLYPHGLSEVLFSIPAQFLRVVVRLLFPAILLSLLCGGISGWLSLRHVATPTPSSPGAPLPISATQLAAQNQLGMLVRVHASAQSSRVLAIGVGTIVLVTVLFIVQRFVLHVTGGDLFVDAVAAIAGVIVLINQAYKLQGQQVVVFQHGLLVPSSAHDLAAIRWEEVDPQQSRLGEDSIILVTKSGFRVVLPITFADFGELKATIAAHMQHAGMPGTHP